MNMQGDFPDGFAAAPNFLERGENLLIKPLEGGG